MERIKAATSFRDAPGPRYTKGGKSFTAVDKLHGADAATSVWHQGAAGERGTARITADNYKSSFILMAAFFS